MAGGFADIGDFFAGNHAGNELAYAKGASIGATTQDALAQARQRVRENTAIEKLQSDPALAAQLGLDAGGVTAVAGGLNVQQLAEARLKNQEVGFRAIAGNADPTVDAGARNRALTGVANGPVETFKAVGAKGYQDVFHPEQGVMETPGAVGAGGGDAAAIQIMRAFGMLDDRGRVVPGKEEQAFDVMRSTQKIIDEGGVPGVTDANPFARHAAPAAPRAPVGAGTDIAPPFVPVPPPAAPAGPVPAAPGAAPAAAPPVASAPAGPVVKPISSVDKVAGNVQAIAKAKEVGTTQGTKSAALPSTVNSLDAFSNDVDALVKQPGFDSIYGHLQGTPVGQTITQALSQDAANASAARDTLKSNSFIVAIQKMRGLGALSNMEGEKVESALSQMFNPRISPDEARAAAINLKARVQSLQQVARQEAGDAAVSAAMGGAAGPAAPAPAAPGVGAYADPAKEARYQAWKAAHGAQ